MNESHGNPAPGSTATAGPNGQTPALGDRVRSLRLGSAGTAGGGSRGGGLLPWGLAVIFFLAATAFGFLAYTRSPAGESTESRDSAPEGASRLAQTTAAPTSTSAAPGAVLLESKGYVVAAHQIQLIPQVGGGVPGRIIQLDPNFKEGAVYKKGDILAKIDAVILEEQLKNARADLDRAKVNLEQVESGSSVVDIVAAKALMASLKAKVDLSIVDERNKRRGGASTTNDDLEKAVIQVIVDQTAHENQREVVRRMETALNEQRRIAKSQVANAEAALAQVVKNLDECTIMAPITGSILTKKAELGGSVNSFAFGASPYLCEMADLSDLEVELDIQERDIARIAVGNRCLIMPEAHARDKAFLDKHKEGYEGVFDRRLPVANRAKGSITVRVKVTIPKDEVGIYLLPDMGAIVTFKQGEAKK